MKRFLTSLSILSEGEVEEVHRSSLRILEEIGLLVPDEEILALLETHGAAVDYRTRISKIPGELAGRAVSGIEMNFRRAPACFGRRPEPGKGEFMLWMCSEPEVVDLDLLPRVRPRRRRNGENRSRGGGDARHPSLLFHRNG